MIKAIISQYEQNKLIEIFVAGVTKRFSAGLVYINKTTSSYFHRLRLFIYQSSSHMEIFEDKTEANESIFVSITAHTSQKNETI
ncbi:ISMha3%2C family IS1595 [Haemophilus influenzae]|nr:Transposase and inactivated derivatives [Streptococcus pneumoniae]CWW71357.1 ISMha3%2C family IS1595 [Haemophilus influenzae]CWW92032.1 ISMha3%2C family IS1595 [Haemophilus influenzae]CWW94875.1 ISMha3%2C family IS1595 [Haemophilus influenzae]CWX09701.1 ISMha3%2C family IS1595 [Haemophilus influenzae]